METLLQPPRTLMEVFDMLPEGTHAELIDNRLYMSPAPTSFHQKILFAIAKTLAGHVEGRHNGEVIS